MISPQRLSVAVFANLANGFRSWRIIVLLLLAVLGSGIATAGFTKAHSWMDEQAQRAFAMQNQGTESEEDGAQSVTEQALKGEAGRAFFMAKFDNEEVVDRVVKIPLPALFYTWLLFFVGPLLSVLIAGPGIASKVGSGHMRFLVLRSSKLEVAIAHFKSSAIIVLALYAAGAVTSFAVSTFMYEGSIGDTAFYLARAVINGWIQSLPYIGIACAVSQCVRSGWAAVGLLLIAMFGIWALGFGLNILVAQGNLEASMAQLLGFFLPDRWENSMWDPSWVNKAPVALLLIALSLMYFFSGFLIFRRRDL